MRKKIIPRTNVTGISNLLQNFFRCFFDGKIFKGDYVKKFEEEFAKYCGVKNAVAVSSGRFGMELILRSLDLKKDDEVIVPAYTLAGLVLIIKKLGLKPVFVDVDLNTFNINPELIEEKTTKRTRAVLATHLYGLPCEIEEIMRIAKKHKVKVIEDCAHSLGAKFQGKKVGSFGDAAFFSFELTKPINTLGGGMVTTNDDEIAKGIRKKIEKLNYSYGVALKKVFVYYMEKFILNSFLWRPVVYLLHSKLKEKTIGFYQKYHSGFKSSQFSFTNFQSHLGLMQLKKIDCSNEKRIKKARLLTGLLRKNRLFDLPKPSKRSKHIYYNYVLRLKESNNDSGFTSKRLLEEGIDTSIGDDTMQNCPKRFGDVGDFPNTEKIIKTAIQLPFYNKITEKEILFISKALNKL